MYDSPRQTTRGRNAIFHIVLASGRFLPYLLLGAGGFCSEEGGTMPLMRM